MVQLLEGPDRFSNSPGILDYSKLIGEENFTNYDSNQPASKLKERMSLRLIDDVHKQALNDTDSHKLRQFAVAKPVLCSKQKDEKSSNSELTFKGNRSLTKSPNDSMVMKDDSLLGINRYFNLSFFTKFILHRK